MVAAIMVHTVHTTGVNYESVAVIVGSVVAALGLLLGILERRNRQIRDDIKLSVDHLSEVLTARLETKDAVASLRADLAGLSQRVADIRQGISDLGNHVV